MPSDLYSDLLNFLDEDEFEEYPVDVDTWIEGEDYLNRPEIHLSPLQREALLNMTQIYKKESLYRIHDTAPGAERRWKQSKSEVCLQWGKGSGKDLISEIACTYIVYQLLCLKDPARYYGKPSGDSIDILNVAVNAVQASNVFFAGFERMVKKSTWFQGKYDAKPGGDPAKSNQFNFNKNVNVYSGHSERESWEGYNLIACFLDEISGFAEAVASGNEGSKTADAIYKMYAASVTSRFSFPYGIVALLSFPRYKGDYIQKTFDRMVANKETITKKHVYKIDPDLPDGIEGNEFDIEWEEEHVLQHTSPQFYAVKAPSWEVNPQKKLEDYKQSFLTDRLDSLARFAAMPPDAVDAFFKDREKVEAAFAYDNGVNNEDGRFYSEFKPDPDKTYYIHVDLARKHDRCAVAMAHVDGWESKRYGETGPKSHLTEVAPRVTVDALRYWTPSKDNEVDFEDVRQYIIGLQQRGFNIGMVSFDQWESDDMRRFLESYGLKTEKLAIKKPHYQDFLGVLMDSRLKAPHDEIAIEELLQLRLTKADKIDHPSTGHNDISDATCGAISQAIAKTERIDSDTIEIKSIKDVVRERRDIQPKKPHNLIEPPKKPMPNELSSYLTQLKVI